MAILAHPVKDRVSKIMEMWRDVPGYEGIYLISDKGRVRSLKWGKDRIMRLKRNRFGYPLISFSTKNKQKTFKVHRLVMLAFVGPSPLCVNHKDFNRSNNDLTNLEYVTYKENNVHSWKAGRVKWARGERNSKSKLTDVDREAVKSLRGIISCTELGEILGVRHSTISRIQRLKT